MVLLAALPALAEDPWADAVIDYHAIDPSQGFDAPQKTVGEPAGAAMAAPNNSAVHSVGRPGAAPGSFITLQFDTPVTDDPANPMGLDAIVFGNAFWVGGNPERKWIEAGLIEISEDVNSNGLADDPWYVIPGSRELDTSVLPGGIANPASPLAGYVQNANTDGTEFNWGYAELTPTQGKYLDNYVRPDDPMEVGLSARSGGGDAFDIAWAVDDTGEPAGIAQFHFIRISAFINAIDGTFGFITPEIDAVADVAPDVDSDGDGILDEYETRVAFTDPARPESTVLALEIPAEEGGSPAGTELGAAADAQGNAITLRSSGLRSGLRDYNCIVDILTVSDPAPGQPIAGLMKSGAVRAYQSSVADFEAAQVQDAEFTLVYASAEIDGLDEPGLAPYRFDGAGYTQDDISAVTKDTAQNRLTFRSRYPGTFILASTAGSGDTGGGAPAIVLNAAPAQATVGNPGTMVTVTSEPILDENEQVAGDGTLFTVATSLGQIATTDADGGEPGVQVASTGGVISFALHAGTTSGTARITAVSLDGTLSGELDYLITAGAATGPVDIFLVNPAATAPGPVDFTTSTILDGFGNPLDEGTRVTLAVLGGEPASADAEPSGPGHQLALTNGVANFSIRVSTQKNLESAPLEVHLYADTAQTQPIGEESFLFTVVELPLDGMTSLLLFLIILGVIHMKRQEQDVL